MTRRVARGATLPPRESDIDLHLIGICSGEYTEEELKLAWAAYGPDLMASFAAHPGLPGFRPVAYWRYELGEEEPDEPTIRLAELGLLRDDEIDRIAARADEGRPLIGTDGEHTDGQGGSADRDAVELHEAVKAALAARPRP